MLTVVRVLVGLAAGLAWLPAWALTYWYLESSIAVPVLLGAVVFTALMWTTVVLMVRPRRRPLAVVGAGLLIVALALAWIGLGYVAEDASSDTDVFDGLGRALGQVFLVASGGAALVSAGAWWVRARRTEPA